MDRVLIFFVFFLDGFCRWIESVLPAGVKVEASLAGHLVRCLSQSMHGLPGLSPSPRRDARTSGRPRAPCSAARAHGYRPSHQSHHARSLSLNGSIGVECIGIRGRVTSHVTGTTDIGPGRST
jgi:hypothetical protein